MLILVSAAHTTALSIVSHDRLRRARHTASSIPANKFVATIGNYQNTTTERIDSPACIKSKPLLISSNASL
jgi:hypothetical protein